MIGPNVQAFPGQQGDQVAGVYFFQLLMEVLLQYASHLILQLGPGLEGEDGHWRLLPALVDVLHQRLEVEPRRYEEEMIERRKVLLGEDVQFWDSADLVVAAEEGIDGGTVERALVVALVHYSSIFILFINNSKTPG